MYQSLEIALRDYALKTGVALSFKFHLSIIRAFGIVAVGLSTLSSTAQPASGNAVDDPVEFQRARVKTAIGKLAPFQLAGCWRNLNISTLVGIASDEDKVVQVDAARLETTTPLSLVQPGDLLVSVDGQVMKSGSARGSRDVAKARMTAFEQFRVRGRPFVEVFKNSKGQEIAVVNPVQLKCRASDIVITGAKDSNARISNLGLFISPARLALLNDEQLLAFLIWNHAFMSLRHETNADAWEFLTLLANGRASSYEYSSSAHEKIDWITLTTLRAMNMNLNVYGSMLSTVQAYDTAIGLSLFGDKRFISKDSGGSPFGGEEKQTRLAAWVQLLEQDAQALAPANLKFSNILLSRPTWSTQTIPLVQLKTVREVLQPILGDADAKDASERYMSTFETIQRPANKPIDEQVAKTLMPATFQMIYAHHPTKRLIWIGRSMPSESDVNLCARPNDCSILVVGPHAVARPSAAWAQVLSEASGAYKLEERQ